PLRLSLQGARQLFNQFIPQIAMGYRTLRKRLYAQLLIVVAKDLVPLRPDRVEPRAKKRRPKSYPWLQEPRSTFKARMAA
ncbi:MAG: IS4 family transposase, partial [Cyanobacteria bacterium P01_F01_bin.86]